MAMSMVRGVFEKSTDAFNRHDVEAFKAFLSDDVSCTAPGNVQLRGKEAVSSFYRSWMDGFPDSRVEFRDVQETDECIVEEGTFSGTHRGVLRSPGGDIPPTGRSLRASFMQVVRFRGERISSFELMYDRLELLEQLGLAEAASAGGRREGRQADAPASAPR